MGLNLVSLAYCGPFIVRAQNLSTYLIFCCILLNQENPIHVPDQEVTVNVYHWTFYFDETGMLLYLAHQKWTAIRFCFNYQEEKVFCQTKYTDVTLLTTM